ncbi:hypothetical protein [Longimicrobium sp.]|uniref:hypothetical protein n=1 Tax=Longimicrobium sp. TaxID=2029185 RepID=UPI002E2FFF76|nr:hypothetical protein [Longimicrobium sp.]HEX6042382.1 hypothetical protein [Longimicrobium sp.]
MTSANRQAQTIWTFLWVPVFLAQLLIERTDFSALWLVRVVAAFLQAFAIVLPIILLVRLFRTPWRTWRRGSLILFALYLLMLSTALHHVQAIRGLFSDNVAFSLYTFAHWTSVLLTSVVAPAALLLMLCLWMAAHHSRWQALDVMAILVGLGVIVLLCLQNTSAHPFDRIHEDLSNGWHYVTCVFLPIALAVAAFIHWGRTLRPG